VSQLRADVETAQDSLSTLERVYAQQLDALQAKEEEAAKAAAALREELKSRQQQQQNDHQQQQQQQQSNQSLPSPSKAQQNPPALAAPGFKWVMIKEDQGNNNVISNDGVIGGGAGGIGGSPGKQGIANAGISGNNISDTSSPGVLPGGSGLVSALAAATARGGPNSNDAAALAALHRTVNDLQATRDRLSEELVRAEGEAASGRVTAARCAALEVEIAGVKQRYTSAMELLGEREEKIEELTADIVEMRDGYRQQIACLADEMERLRQRVLELETVQ
jgi:TATA element modulatory factor